MEALKKQVADLFANDHKLKNQIMGIGKNPETDKLLRNNPPTPTKKGHRLMRGTFWYLFHYQIWPRLFGASKERQEEAMKYLYERRNTPQKPIFQKVFNH